MSRARREWAEAFLRYKIQEPGRTNEEAKAMATVAVDVTRAEVEYEIARLTTLYWLEDMRNADQP